MPPDSDNLPEAPFVSGTTFSIKISGGSGADALDVPVRFLVSPRARRIRLRVPSIGPVLLLAPPACDPATALRFLGEQHRWILGALARREKMESRPGAPARAATLTEFFEKHPRLCALGRTYALEVGPTANRPFMVWKPAEEPVVFRLPEGQAREDALRSAVRLFATKALPPRVTELAAPCGVSVGRICVRNQRGRWGSCSGHGALSLNWRLVLLPPELQDYVIHHELAHRVEMNHSDRFWSLLSEWNPRNGWLDRDLSRDWGWLMDIGRAH